MEDLPVLRGLWGTARFPAFELEKRLTEFQLVTRADGVLTGAIGLRVSGWHVLLHHEAFYSNSGAEIGRPVLFEKIRKLIAGEGAARLWMAAPIPEFWQEVGFEPARAGELSRLPAEFSQSNRAWHTFALRDDALLERAMEKDFARLREEGRMEADRLKRQARLWKWAAGLIALGFFLGAIWLLFEMLSGAAQR